MRVIEAVGVVTSDRADKTGVVEGPNPKKARRDVSKPPQRPINRPNLRQRQLKPNRQHRMQVPPQTLQRANPTPEKGNAVADGVVDRAIAVEEGIGEAGTSRLPTNRHPKNRRVVMVHAVVNKYNYEG